MQRKIVKYVKKALKLILFFQMEFNALSFSKEWPIYLKYPETRASHGLHEAQPLRSPSSIMAVLM